MTDLWVVVDIGCLECHADSDCLGVYTSQDRAEAAVASILAQRRTAILAERKAANLREPDFHLWPTGIDYSDASEGDGQIRVFRVPALDTPGEYQHVGRSTTER